MRPQARTGFRIPQMPDESREMWASGESIYASLDGWAKTICWLLQLIKNCKTLHKWTWQLTKVLSQKSFSHFHSLSHSLSILNPSHNKRRLSLDPPDPPVPQYHIPRQRATHPHSAGAGWRWWWGDTSRLPVAPSGIGTRDPGPWSPRRKISLLIY